MNELLDAVLHIETINEYEYNQLKYISETNSLIEFWIEFGINLERKFYCHYKYLEYVVEYLTKKFKLIKVLRK